MSRRFAANRLVPNTCGLSPSNWRRGTLCAAAEQTGGSSIDLRTIVGSSRPHTGPSSNPAQQDEVLAPDAEWLVDNYYIVEEQLREIREDLPRRFYLELPKLTDGPFADFPRVYELAHELVVHTDSSLDEELIGGFIAAYQRKTALTSGEIWAVPIMLRLVLVENLRRLCSQMLVTRESRPQAELILKKWQAQDVAIPRLDANQDCSIIVELVELLSRSSLIHHGTSDHELFERLGVTPEMIDECMRREQQRLAANQVSIGNLITSMRLLTALDWSLFFERVSLVEQILRQDPAGIYPLMDFATRDQYRHEIERIAKHGEHDETLIAGAALRHASAEFAKRDAGPAATSRRLLRNWRRPGDNSKVSSITSRSSRNDSCVGFAGTRRRCIWGVSRL